MKKIGKEQLRKARQTLAKYKEGKAVLDKRIVSNEQWWKLRHWGEIGYDKDDTRPMPHRRGCSTRWQISTQTLWTIYLSLRCFREKKATRRSQSSYR